MCNTPATGDNRRRTPPVSPRTGPIPDRADPDAGSGFPGEGDPFRTGTGDAHVGNGLFCVWIGVCAPPGRPDRVHERGEGTAWSPEAKGLQGCYSEGLHGVVVQMAFRWGS